MQVQMKPNTYNMYLKIVSLACSNVKTEICNLNMFKGDEVTVQIRGKDNMVDLADKISKNPSDAIAKHSKDADKLLVIRSTEPTIKMLTAGRIFVESVLSSRSSRVAQRRLVQYGAVEKFLGEAYVYDSKHQSQAGVNSAMSKAKNIVTKKCSLAVLGSFDFDRGRPVLDSTIKKELEQSAFNARFAFLTKEKLAEMIEKKYKEDFAGLTSEFSAAKPVSPIESMKVDKAINVKKQPPVQSKETPITSHTLLLNELWNKKFADLPLLNKRRKFVNLSVRHNDVFVAPKPVLIRFRQASVVESMTKHQFIMDYYLDAKPADFEEPDVARYLFRQENNMYKYMWGENKGVRCNNGRLYFPDGTNMLVPSDMTPHEFFHRVNAIYAALFGFNKEDVKGGNDWLYDAVREAYTDEGMAEYRLEVINNRLKSMERNKK